MKTDWNQVSGKLDYEKIIQFLTEVQLISYAQSILSICQFNQVVYLPEFESYQ